MSERPILAIVDLTGVTATAELHATLATALGFPDFYGGNWDAFWDAITGLVAMPETLRLVGWTVFATRLPDDAAMLRRLLDRMTLEYPDQAPTLVYA